MEDPNLLKELYEKDYLEWIDRNLELLKNKQYNLVDWDNLIEEIQGLRDKYIEEAVNYLAVILDRTYRLNHFQHDMETGKQWRNDIFIAKSKLICMIEEFPSLQQRLPKMMQKVWRRAILNIKTWLIDNDINPDTVEIPEMCDYKYDDIIIEMQDEHYGG